MTSRTCDLQLLSTNPLRARATFPPNFPGFDGHFPDAPILPGFMHIQLAIDTLVLAGHHAKLESVTNAKFLRGIPPATQIEIAIIQQNATTHRVEISDGAGNPCSHFTIHTSSV